MLHAGVVVLHGLIRARLDAGFEFKVTGLVGREAECDDLLAIGAEGDFPFVHLGVAELENDLRLFSGEALGTDAHVGHHLVLHEGDLGREEVRHDDVPRAGDAQPVDVKRDAVLLELRRQLARGEPAVVAAVGEEDHAGQGLAAL